MNETLPLEERWKMLKKKKRQNLDKMKRLNRSYIKAKLEKKRINQEVKQLQKEWQELLKKDPASAKEAFAQEMRNVTADDIFPKDLEAEFDKIELRSIKKGRTMKTEDLSEDHDLGHHPATPADLLERELEEELGDHDEAEDKPTEDGATEPDEETKRQLEGESDNLGLTAGDLFIDEDGNEEELTPHDENHGV